MQNFWINLAKSCMDAFVVAGIGAPFVIAIAYFVIKRRRQKGGEKNGRERR